MPLRAVKRRRTRPSAREGFRAVGLILRPRGLHGELKVQSLTNFPERFDVGATIYLDGEPREVLASRYQAETAHIQIEGVRSRIEADQLRGFLLEVPESDRAELSEGEFYLDELEGCAVVDEAGNGVGVVREVLQPGANDVYVVAREGRSDLLLPAITGVVLEIRMEDRTVVVDVPPGLERDSAD